MSAREARNRERECGPGGTKVWFSPDAAPMSLDDRAADELPNPHAVVLGRVERIEQGIESR